MTVSVLIPVYNVQAYVQKALESISFQTYRDIEILVCDDASTDATYYIISRCAEKDNRIRVFQNASNRGIVDTLNFLLSQASGAFILRMDGDDISEPNRIETLLAYLVANDNVDLLGSSLTTIDLDNKVIGKTKFYNNQQFFLKTAKYRTPVAHVWLAKKSLYDALNGYRPIKGVEDYDFVLRAITSGYVVANLSDYYGYWVRIARSGNTISSLGINQRLAFKYAYHLYLERRKKTVDSFTVSQLAKRVNATALSRHLYRYGSEMLQKAVVIRQKSFPLFCFYIFLSMFSPHHFVYAKDRFVYQFYCRWFKL